MNSKILILIVGFLMVLVGTFLQIEETAPEVANWLLLIGMVIEAIAIILLVKFFINSNKQE